MATRLLAAADEVSITPPLGATLLGFVGPASGVNDELSARVLILSDGPTTVALMTLDLAGMDFALADEMRAAVQVATGADLVVLAATHTHSAPFTIPWSLKGREWLGGPQGLQWRDDMLRRVAQVAAETVARLQPADLRAGRAPVQVGFNRRTVTPDGVVMRPKPDGVTVPWVDVLCVDDEAGEPLAVLFSHAAHPVIVHEASSLISADYPGYTVAALRRWLPETVVAMFAQGCGANINGEPWRGGLDAARRAGEALAEAVGCAVAQAQPVPPGPLRTATVVTHLPLNPLPPLEECQDLVRRTEERVADAAGVDQATQWYMLDDALVSRDLLHQAAGNGPGAVRFEASAVAVGDAWGVVAMTHEVFAEYQLWLEGVSPWAHTMATAYTNGCESYIPTDAALAEGGYEAATYPSVGAAARYPYRVAVAPGAEARVRDAIRAVLQAASPRA